MSDRIARQGAPGREELTVSVVRDGAADGFAEAAEAVERAPQDVAGWERLEAMATQRQQTERVDAMYRAALAGPLPAPTRLSLGERAVSYHDAWIESHDGLLELLARVLEIAPATPWALDRASLLMTMLGLWDELLALYDRAIEAVGPEPRRLSLLAEAAHIAKDSAGQSDRAIGYLEELFRADRANLEVAASLERLLQQQRRYRDLITFWTRRMEVAEAGEGAELRRRTAACLLLNLDDPGGALTMLDPLCTDPAGAESACELIEKILAAPSSDAETRRRALERLRGHYDAQGRWSDVVRVLGAALAHAHDRGRVELHAEIARRLVEHGREDDAREHLVALVALDPDGCDDAMLDQLLAETFEGTIAGCRPRIGRAFGRDLLHRAARMAESVAETRPRAAHLYLRLLRDTPTDPRAIAGLGALYEHGGQRAELLSLRQHELGIATDLARRLELRLEIATLHGALGDAATRVRVLQQNLDEKPDDRASIDAIVSALESDGDLAALATLLETHAARLDGASGGQLAAELWTRAAAIAERDLGDLRRAVRCQERVLAIAPGPLPFDALARMHGDLGEHATAVRWLEQLIAATPPSARTGTFVRLAQAYVAAGQREEAVSCLERGLAHAPEALEMRTLHIDLLRALDRPEAMVASLIEGAATREGREQLPLLGEAAATLLRTLRAPERAVPLLERMVAIDDTQAPVRLQLADALRRAGRLDEARGVAEALIAQFGRRRSTERAGVHVMLARVLRTQRLDAEAVRELEAAVGMDMGNVSALRMLAQTYRDAEQIEQAERSFQALLLVQRRLPPSAPAGSGGGSIAETLFELHRLSARLGREEQAAESLASAFDAASRSEHEARRFERTLRKAGRPELLLRALEQRLATAEGPARATILGETAALLRTLGRSAEALEHALRGLALTPDDAGLHELAREVTVDLGQVARYVACLEAAVEVSLRAGDGTLGCALLLRLGDVFERDLSRPEAAAVAYARAEDTCENLVEVWRRRAATALALGDRATRLLSLRKLVDAARDGGPGPDLAGALYALADHELTAGDTIEAGLATLALALEAAPRPAVAAASLRGALTVAVDRAPVAQLYEAVARASGDDATLLDALLAASALPEPTQALLEEAFALAGRLQAEQAAAGLLARAVEVADASAEPGSGLWAMRHLADGCEGGGDLRGALAWLGRAADVAPAEESGRLLARLAALAAGPGREPELALRTYERLRDQEPGNAQAWLPMLDVLRAQGDLATLELALEKAAELVQDAGRRTGLRMERARVLLSRPDRVAEAIATLRAVLEEEPDHAEAGSLLSDALESTGRLEELAALLARQLDAARDRTDADQGVALALRLAALRADVSKVEAADVLRSALEWLPQATALMAALVGLLDAEKDAGERADLLERLVGLETGPGRFARALELARTRGVLGDRPGLERALAVASSLDPHHPAVREQVRAVAEAMIAEAAARPDHAVKLLCDAATKLREVVGDPAAALAAIETARALRPDDVRVLDLMARCMIDVGQADAAVFTLSEAIERCPAGAPRLAGLLGLRALIWTACRQSEAAVADLEEAFVVGGKAFLGDLTEALQRVRDVLSARGDRAAERAVALRQAEVFELADKEDAARGVLAAWVARFPDDREAIERVLTLDSVAGRWEEVAAGYQRLLSLEDEDRTVEIALQLADAWGRAGRPEAARAGLERAYRLDPSHADVRARLRELYTKARAQKELSGLLLVDARHAVDDAQRYDLLVEGGRIRLQDLDEAAASIGPLSEALELRPTSDPLVILLAEAYRRAGLLDEAAELLQGAIARHGGKRSRDVATLQQAMARIAGAHDRKNQLSWLVAAFESNPKSAALDTELADLATELGEYETALKALRALASQKDLGPAARAGAYVKQARIARLQGDPQKAQFLAKRALTEDAELAEARDLLRELGAKE